MKKTVLIVFAILVIVLVIISCNKKNTFTDKRDNETYKTVNIGNQIFMAENLNFESESGSGTYQNDSSLSKVYGRLYSWKTACEVCPDGWHLPSDKEWTELINYLGGDSIAGGKMKTQDILLWKMPNTGATNNSGFTALPSGYGIYTIVHSEFHRMGENTYFWSSTINDEGHVWARTLDFKKESVKRDWFSSSGYYLSVRCVRD